MSLIVLSTAFTVGLFAVAAAFNQLANLTELFRRRAPGRERLEHELRRRSTERAIEQVAHELPLGLLFGLPRLIDVRTIRVVAPDEPLLRHDLEHLQRGGVTGGTVAGKRFVD